jgi:hypothetical protein
MSKNNVSAIISNDGNLTIFITGKSYNITTDHPNYNKIITALKAKTFDVIPNLIDVGAAITEYGEGNLVVDNGMIFYKGMPIRNALTDRIFAFIEKELPYEPLLRFMENLMENPSKRSVEELYTFLEANELPITEDGFVLGYKRVNDDFKDLYTGKVDNSIGAINEMPRNFVDDDKEKTCSFGYHIAGKSYLKHYCAGQGKIIVVKFNPKDAVSVPVDYQNSKIRVCRYEVLYEITNDIDVNDDTQEYFEEPAYSTDGKTILPKRDSKGRFMSNKTPVKAGPKRDSRGRFVR